MDEKNTPPQEQVPEEDTPSAALPAQQDEAVTQNPAPGGDQRIQFAPTVRPSEQRKRPAGADDDQHGISLAPSTTLPRRSSVNSVPPVITEKEKERREREKEAKEKHVDIDEHLLPHNDVAERYKTQINMNRPGDSSGLTSAQAEEMLAHHGLNVLTPPKKRHPILKFLDCLRSLFNLLLIFAGILEYILLGINYQENFQNVSAYGPISGLRRWSWHSAPGHFFLFFCCTKKDVTARTAPIVPSFLT